MLLRFVRGSAFVSLIQKLRKELSPLGAEGRGSVREGPLASTIHRKWGSNR